MYFNKYFLISLFLITNLLHAMDQKSSSGQLPEPPTKSMNNTQYLQNVELWIKTNQNNTAVQAFFSSYGNLPLGLTASKNNIQNTIDPFVNAYMMYKSQKEGSGSDNVVIKQEYEEKLQKVEKKVEESEKQVIATQQQVRDKDQQLTQLEGMKTDEMVQGLQRFIQQGGGNIQMGAEQLKQVIQQVMIETLKKAGEAFEATRSFISGLLNDPNVPTLEWINLLNPFATQVKDTSEVATKHYENNKLQIFPLSKYFTIMSSIPQRNKYDVFNELKIRTQVLQNSYQTVTQKLQQDPNDPLSKLPKQILVNIKTALDICRSVCGTGVFNPEMNSIAKKLTREILEAASLLFNEKKVKDSDKKQRIVIDGFEEGSRMESIYRGYSFSFEAGQEDHRKILGELLRLFVGQIDSKAFLALLQQNTQDTKQIQNMSIVLSSFDKKKRDITTVFPNLLPNQITAFGTVEFKNLLSDFLSVIELLIPKDIVDMKKQLFIVEQNIFKQIIEGKYVEYKAPYTQENIANFVINRDFLTNKVQQIKVLEYIKEMEEFSQSTEMDAVMGYITGVQQILPKAVLEEDIHKKLKLTGNDAFALKVLQTIATDIAGQEDGLAMLEEIFKESLTTIKERAGLFEDPLKWSTLFKIDPQDGLSSQLRNYLIKDHELIKGVDSVKSLLINLDKIYQVLYRNFIDLGKINTQALNIQDIENQDKADKDLIKQFLHRFKEFQAIVIEFLKKGTDEQIQAVVDPKQQEGLFGKTIITSGFGNLQLDKLVEKDVYQKIYSALRIVNSVALVIVNDYEMQQINKFYLNKGVLLDDIKIIIVAIESAKKFQTSVQNCINEFDKFSKIYVKYNNQQGKNYELINLKQLMGPQQQPQQLQLGALPPMLQILGQQGGMMMQPPPLLQQQQMGLMQAPPMGLPVLGNILQQQQEKAPLQKLFESQTCVDINKVLRKTTTKTQDKLKEYFVFLQNSKTNEVLIQDFEYISNKQNEYLNKSERIARQFLNSALIIMQSKIAQEQYFTHQQTFFINDYYTKLQSFWESSYKILPSSQKNNLLQDVSMFKNPSIKDLARKLSQKIITMIFDKINVQDTGTFIKTLEVVLKDVNKMSLDQISMLLR
ncbi:MAG: hypothetical protein ACTSXG_02505 [Alphaproteobacteria bacterium]